MEEPKSQPKPSKSKQSGHRYLPSAISRQPSDKEFKIAEREKRLLQELFDWEERSRNTRWVLGQPIGI